MNADDARQGAHLEIDALLDTELSKKAAAGRLGISRRTVTRWRKEREPSRRKPRIHKLDPYKGIIRTWLEN